MRVRPQGRTIQPWGQGAVGTATCVPRTAPGTRAAPGSHGLCFTTKEMAAELSISFTRAQYAGAATPKLDPRLPREQSCPRPCPPRALKCWVFQKKKKKAATRTPPCCCKGVSLRRPPVPEDPLSSSKAAASPSHAQAACSMASPIATAPLTARPPKPRSHQQRKAFVLDMKTRPREV